MDAFGQGLCDNYRDLTRYAMRLTTNSIDAEDLVQSTLERALEKRSLFKEGTNLTTWLMTILKHIFLNDWRRARHAERYAETKRVTYIPIADKPQEEYVMFTEIARLFDTKLDPLSRKILCLFAVMEEPQQDIARRFNVAPGTVKSRISRARDHLEMLVNA